MKQHVIFAFKKLEIDIKEWMDGWMDGWNVAIDRKRFEFNPMRTCIIRYHLILFHYIKGAW